MFYLLIIIMEKERAKLKGFNNYKVSKDWVVEAWEQEVIRKGTKWNYKRPAHTVKASLDKGTWYTRIYMKRDTGKRHNLLIHRVVYCAFNGLEYTDDKLIVCHIDDDRTNNHLDNLYGWTQKDNMSDIQLKNRLLGLYKQGKIIIKD